jgi:L-2-hydroxyglutarate oxidase LhgO
LYLYSEEPIGFIKTHIYHLPDLRNPFLGVHFTVMAKGMSKMCPTAIPAFWREQYTRISNFRLDEFTELSLRQAGLFLNSNFDFKQLAWQEIRKYSRSHLVNLASPLLKDVKLSNFKKLGNPGIRAQLLNIKNNTLEIDFLLKETVNPFIFSMPFPLLLLAPFVLQLMPATKSKNFQIEPKQVL